MEASKVDRTGFLREHAELKLENVELRKANAKLRDQLHAKDRIIEDLNEKLDCLDKKKNIRFLRPAKIAPGTTMEHNDTVISPETQQPRVRADHCHDHFEKNLFTGYYHKFLKQTSPDSKHKCDRCHGEIKRHEEMQQCIFCSESFHTACAFATGRLCLSRGNVHGSQKRVD